MVRIEFSIVVLPPLPDGGLVLACSMRGVTETGSFREEEFVLMASGREEAHSLMRGIQVEWAKLRSLAVEVDEEDS